MKNIDFEKTIIPDVLLILLLILLSIWLHMPITAGFGISTEQELAIDEEVCDGDYRYLADPDSYLFARRAIEFANKERSLSPIVHRSEDKLMSQVSSEMDGFTGYLLSIIAALVYKAANLFNEVSILPIIYMTSAFLASLAAIPAYCFVRRRTNRFGGCIAGIAAVMSMPFFSHSSPGYFDTDSGILLLALCFMCCLGEAALSEKNSRWIWAGFAVAFYILLGMMWEAYYVYLLIAVVCLGAACIFRSVFRKKDGLKVSAGDKLLFPIVTVTLIAATLIFSGKDAVSSILQNLKSVTMIGGNWPDASKYIGELQRWPFVKGETFDWFAVIESSLISRLGGMGSLVGTVLCLILMILACIKSRHHVNLFRIWLFCTVFFGIWFIGTFPVIFFGVRFLQLPAIPMCIILGLGMGLIKAQPGNPAFKASPAFFCLALVSAALLGCIVCYLNLWGGIAAGIISAILLVFFGPNEPAFLAWVLAVGVFLAPVHNARFTATQSAFACDTLRDACDYIRDNSEENAVIVSWWGYGYYYEYEAERRAICDGGMINGEYHYWLATALTADDEELSAGVSRMLASCGTDASQLATRLTGSEKAGTELLKSILPLEKAKAEEYLKAEYKLSSKDSAELIRLAFPEDPPELYYILPQNAVTGLNLIQYYSAWDFENDGSERTVMVSGHSVEAPEKDDAPVRVKLNGSTEELCAEYRLNDDEEIEFSLFRTDTPSENEEAEKLSRMIVIKDGGIEYAEDLGQADGYTFVMIEEEGRLSSIVCSPDTADTLLFKMFLTDISGESFEKVYSGVVPEAVNGEPSVIQRMLGTADDIAIPVTGVVVYKVK